MARRLPAWLRFGLVVVGLALPLIVAVVALAGRRWYPVLDLAMTEFRIRDVGTSETPLIGLPGRIGELPEQGSHPGPLSFWLLAPGYRLFGSSAWSMEVATILLHTVWIGVALWIGHRRLGTLGIATVAAVVALLVRGYGLTTLVQPWNPYLPLIAWLVIVLATWSVFCGDHLMLIPLVAAASFAAQTHIPYLLMAGALGVVSIGVVFVRWWSDRRRDGDAGAPRLVIVTAGVFALLWVPPVVDQLRRTPGNFSLLLDHFGSPPDDPIGSGAGLRLLVRHLDPLGAFADLVTGDGRFLEVGFEPDGPISAGVALLLLWGVAAVVSRRLDRPALVHLHEVIALTLLLSFVSMSRIFGERWFYLTLWAWTTTTLMMVAIVWTGLLWWRERRPTSAPSRQQVVVTVAALAAVTTASMVVMAPSTDHAEEYLGETVGELLDPTVAAIEGGVGVAAGRDATYAVVWEDAYFFGSQAFGLLNELRRAGIDARTYDFWRVPSTPGRSVGDRVVTGEIVFATGGFVEELRNDVRAVEVASVEPRDAAELAEFEELRSLLIDDLAADGLDDLVDEVDVNLFGVRIDPRISDEARRVSTTLIGIGQETAVFIGPPGVTL